MNVLPVAVAPGVSPAEWDSEPGRGCVAPAARRRCSPPTTRRWPSCSAGSPSAPPAPCSTESPPPASCDVTGRAPPHAPGRSHKSEQNGKKRQQLYLSHSSKQLIGFLVFWKGGNFCPSHSAASGPNAAKTFQHHENLSNFPTSGFLRLIGSSCLV